MPNNINFKVDSNIKRVRAEMKLLNSGFPKIQDAVMKFGAQEFLKDMRKDALNSPRLDTFGNRLRKITGKTRDSYKVTGARSRYAVQSSNKVALIHENPADKLVIKPVRASILAFKYRGKKIFAHKVTIKRRHMSEYTWKTYGDDIYRKMETLFNKLFREASR